MAELEPITLRERYQWEPLKIKLPRVPVTFAGTHLVVPVIVDWFAMPEWTYFWNPLEGSRDPHFFNPNLISVEIAR